MVLVAVKLLLSIIFLFSFFLIQVYALPLGFDRAVVRVQYSSTTCPTAVPPDVIDPSVDLGIACCVGGTATLSTYSNCMAIYNLVCTDSCETYQPSDYKFQTVINVASGFEGASAIAAQNAFLAIPLDPAIPKCASSYINGGWISYFIYESFIDPVTNSISVDVSSYRDFVCSKTGIGTFTPISVLSGSGSGVGLTQAETAAAVITGVAALDTQLQALNSKLAITNQTLSSIDSKTGLGGSVVDYGLMSGSVTTGVNNSVLSSKLDQLILNTASGSGSGGLTELQTASAVQAGLNNAAGLTSGSLGMAAYKKPVSYINTEFSSFGSFNFGSRINTFVTDVKTAPLFSSFTLGGLAATPAGVSSMPVSFGSFGTANFDLATYAGVYDYIKGFLLLLGSYLAVRIVVLKR